MTHKWLLLICPLLLLVCLPLLASPVTALQPISATENAAIQLKYDCPCDQPTARLLAWTAPTTATVLIPKRVLVPETRTVLVPKTSCIEVPAAVYEKQYKTPIRNWTRGKYRAVLGTPVTTANPPAAGATAPQRK